VSTNVPKRSPNLKKKKNLALNTFRVVLSNQNVLVTSFANSVATEKCGVKTTIFRLFHFWEKLLGTTFKKACRQMWRMATRLDYANLEGLKIS
jgi:hypothetical protein